MVTKAQRYKDITRKCTHCCPSCSRFCVFNADHTGQGIMHKCGLHEWAYALGGKIKIVITDIVAEESHGNSTSH